MTGSGYALEDHFADGRALERLGRERWSLVVLQQGPSALESSRVNLREWSARFAPLIAAAGARPALYAVWPEKARFFDFPRVSESYRLAAADVHGLFFPAATPGSSHGSAIRACPCTAATISIRPPPAPISPRW